MNRIEKLQQRMKEQQVDTCLISDRDAMQYFIQKGFSCGERMVVLAVKQQGRPLLFLNELFPTEQLEGVELIRFKDTDDSVLLLKEHCTGPVIGIDKAWPSGFLLRLMQLLPECQFTDGATLSNQIRSIKSQQEQQKMRRASQLNDAVMQKVRTFLRPGVTEKQVAEQIHEAFRQIAQSEPSFDTIVAFQENCADPHAIPGSKVLEAGMSVIVDMGCRFEGYCSDMTRTFFLEENTMEEIYQIVLKANLAAIAAVGPHATFRDVDLAARRVIEEAGYGPYFIHRTGHGIGLSVHEPYDVSSVNDAPLQPGMCFSIEPGIYLPHQGGVRIEDLVLVTEDGCEVLNHDPKDQPVISWKQS